MQTSLLNQLRVDGVMEQDGFSLLPGVFGKQEIEHLINAMTTISDDRGVRSRGGVYAIRNLLQLSSVVP
jgi:hypothetical protein